MTRNDSARRTLLGSCIVVGLAALVRLPHYDVAWLGFDTLYFLADARRAVGGGAAAGPLATGLDIVGPLYSYFLAAFLWLRDDPRTLLLLSAVWDVAGCWFVYDASRRMFGVSAGVTAAATFALVPSLIVGARITWNPSLLPAVVACGWWSIVRYCQSPSTGRLAAIALLCGVTQPLHITGLFHAAAWCIAVLVARPPSVRQLPVALIAGLLPTLPVLVRLFDSHAAVSALGSRLVTGSLTSTLAGIRDITLGFPRALLDANRAAPLSMAILHAQTVVAFVGFIVAFVRRGRFLPVWLGVVVALGGHIVGSLVYSGQLTWYYFLGLVPTICLGMAAAVDLAGRRRLAVGSAAVLLAGSHLWFLLAMDRAAIASGMIRIQPIGLFAHAAPGATLHALTTRRVAAIGQALRGEMPDGSTAMLNSHGAIGELWRETGGELLPQSAAPAEAWPRHFLPMGTGAAPVTPDARVIAENLCVFDARPVEWRVRPGAPVAGWEQPLYADADWTPLRLPQRIVGASRAGPAVSLASWPGPMMALRGRFAAQPAAGPRRIAVVAHGLGGAQHWIAGAFLNGTALTAVKSRVVTSSFFRIEEWLFDVTASQVTGENVFALHIDGHAPTFDLDVFEVPCADAEWYD